MSSSTGNSNNHQSSGEQQTNTTHSFFNTVADFAVSGYDRAAKSINNDAAKGLLISQRGTFEKTVKSAAYLSDKAVEAVAMGAEKLVTGDHHYVPDPLPNWLNPRDPILNIQSTIPLILFYGGITIYHRHIQHAADSILSKKASSSVLFFSFKPENETEDPYQCGPKEGSFEPLFGRILWRTGILKKEDLCTPQINSPLLLINTNTNNNTTNGKEEVRQEEQTGRSLLPPTAADTKINQNSNNSDPSFVKVPKHNASSGSSGFDLLPDIPLGGTVSGSNSPFNSTKQFDNTDEEKKESENVGKNDDDDDATTNNTTKNNDTNNKQPADEKKTDLAEDTYAAFQTFTDGIGNFLNLNATVNEDTVAKTAKSGKEDENDNHHQNDAAAETSRSLVDSFAAGGNDETTRQPRKKSFTAALKSIGSSFLAALHPSFVFVNNSRSSFSFNSYHFISASFFTMTAVTSYMGLRKVATQKGVQIRSMIPTVTRFAKDVLPMTWTGGVISSFGSQPVDLANTLQFGLTFGTCGAILHLFAGAVQTVTRMFDEGSAHNSKNGIEETRRLLVIQTGGTPADDSSSSPMNYSPQNILRYCTLASHYTSLLLDLNFTFQLCVLSPSLPPVVKIWPALYFALITRKQYLCDNEYTKSYLGSHTRWILYAGALRHFCMLCESTPKNNNFLAHAFPRVLSLGLLPIHLASFWLPMNPLRAFDEKNGGLLRTMFGFVTGTAWSPGALAAANLAWTALYLTQGTSSMEDALPRVKTMNESSLPIPLYLISAEVLISIGKMLTTVV